MGSCAFLNAANRTDFPGPVTALIFSPDSKLLLSSGPGEVQIRSPENATVTGRIPSPWPQVRSIGFSPDARLLAIGGGESGSSGGFQMVDYRSLTPLFQETRHKDLVTGVAFSPDGSWLAVSSWDHSVVLWRAGQSGNTWASAITLTGHSGPVLAVAFSPDSSQVLTAGMDRSIKVWSVRAGELVRSFSHHLDTVHALAFRPGTGVDGAPPYTFASASDDRTIRVWQPGLGRMVRIIRSHVEAPLALVYSGDGARLFTAGREGVIRIFEGESDRQIQEFKAHPDWIHALALRPDGRAIASGDWKGAVRIRPLP